MNREEARKLLGGYATGNLTAEERRLLFEAALDDQELFAALAEEQALKDVLDDPVSRERVRLAVATAPRARGWWTRAWIWVPAAGALAGAALTVALVNWKPGQIHEEKKNTAIADNRPVLKATQAASPAQSNAAKTRDAKAAVPKVAAGKLAGSAAAPPPAPAQAAVKDAESSKQSEAPAAQSSANGVANTANTSGSPGNTRSDKENTQQQNVGQQARRESAPSVRGQEKEQAQAPPSAPASVARTTGFLARPASGRGTAAPVAWSLLRGEADGRESELAAGARPRVGDRVRVRVTTAAPGYVELSLRDSSGIWQPWSRKIAVVANAVYTIPETPLEVTPGEALRLTWWPEDATDYELQDGRAAMRKTKERLETKATAPASRQRVVTDIPLH